MNASSFEWLPELSGVAGFQWVDSPGTLGAGPGETRVYFVDAPWPWGENTQIVLPTEALMGDAVGYARRYLPGAVDDAVYRLRQHLPYLGPEVAASVWPTLQRQIEAELPKLIAQVQPEVKQIEKRFEWALGLTVLGVAAVAGVFWYKMRGK